MQCIGVWANTTATKYMYLYRNNPCSRNECFARPSYVLRYPVNSQYFLMWKEEIPELDEVDMDTSDDDQSEIRVNVKRRTQLRIRAQKRQRLILYLSVCSLLAIASFVRLVKWNNVTILSDLPRGQHSYLRGSNSLIYKVPFVR